jgi:phosphoribosylformimino-5-aminoimidazole carboxamide ribotide isomerase
MILFPAIDLKDGQCVRLKLGEMSQATVFNDSPAAQARSFQEQGFEYLHIVDLNGAFAGKPINGPAVEAILAAIKIPVQLGGGIRDLATIEAWLAKGIRRVILGTVAVRDPGLVRDACRKFPGRIAVGIDARGGKVAVEGWAETSELSAIDMRNASRAPASLPSSTPTSTAMAFSRASTCRPRPSSPPPHRLP